jgi:uncharacterized protein (TIGR02453 family)
LNNTTLSPATFAFLADLRANNERDWFNANNDRYKAAHADVIAFADVVLALLRKHDDIETTSGRRSLFRLHRDNRFHPNRPPYKTWFSGHFKRATAVRRGGYYFHLEPGGNTHVGGGFYKPEAADLAHIRAQIAADPEPLRNVLADQRFRDTFGELLGEQVKTAPRGYPRDHPAVDLLRYKSMFAMRSFTDDEVLSADFSVALDHTLQALRPFLDYMSTILTTDLNGESLG